MRGKVSKRVLAAILSFSMMVSLVSVPAEASDASLKKSDTMTEQALKEKLVSAVSSKKYPKGMIAFGESQLTGAEGEDSQLLVVRAGGTKGKAKVTLKAIGVSAKYGQDYLMTVHDGKKSTVLEAKDNVSTLMEKYGDSLSVKAADEKQVQESTSAADSKAAAAQSGDEVAVDDLSGTAKAAALQNGKAAVQKSWREMNDKSDADYQSAEALMTEGKSNLLNAVKKMEGVEYTFTFKDGEYKKEVDLTAIDDELSEGDEQVMFILSDASGAELSENYTGYFNIRDNEKEEVNTYEMAAASATVKRGESAVELTVNKTKGTNRLSVLTVGTKELTAKPGVDYEAVNEALVFAPGMTSKTVTIPLIADADTTEDVSFYVGLQSDDGVINTKKSAALVTVTGRQQEEKVVYRNVTSGGKMSTKANDGNTKTLDGCAGCTVEASNTSSEKSKTVFSGEDLRTASQIKITFHSNEGSTTVKDGCSKVEKRDRKVRLVLTGKNGYSQEIYSSGQTSSINSTTATWDFEYNSNYSSMSLNAYVQPVNSNKNAKLTIDSVTITYREYTVQMDNNPISSQKIKYDGNAYQPKIWKGENDSAADGSPFRLGEGFVNKNASSNTFKNCSDNLNLSFSYDNTDKRVSKSTVDFNGFQIYNCSSQKWDDLVSYANAKGCTLETLLSKGSNYVSGNTIQLRPKFTVKQATIKFMNTDCMNYNQQGKDGKTTTVQYKKSNLGSFRGFNNGTAFKKATLLDTIDIVASPQTGYAIEGFSVVNSKSNKSVAVNKTSQANEIKLAPATTDQINVDIQYQKSKIRIMADPAGKNTEKGAVIYEDPLDPSKIFKGDKDNPIEIEDVVMNAMYSVIGLTDDKYKTKDYQYRAVWSDGTLDADEDGDLDDKEQKSSYQGFKPVSGNVLSFSPSVAYMKIYYDFEMRETASTAGGNVQCLVGGVSLEDSEIFSGKKMITALNGVTVTADGDTDVTHPLETATTYSQPRAGYYEMDGDGTYNKKDYMLLSFNYNAPDGSVMTQNVVSNPNYFQNVVFKADSIMEVASANVSVVTGEGKNQTESAVKWNSMDNGDKIYRMRFKVNSRNNDIQPRSACLNFYHKDGTKYADKEIKQEISAKDSGNFQLDFNPKELGLAPGTTIKFQVYDQNGKAYYQRSTGISLMESVGILDFANSFEFGSANTIVQLLGNINSSFDLGWEGDFFDATNENIVVDEEGTMVLSMGFDTGEINKNLYGGIKRYDSVATAAKAKAEAQEKYVKETLKVSKKDNPTESDQKKLESLKSDMEKAGEKLDEKMAKASNPRKTTTNVAAGVSADVSVSLEIAFGRDEEKSAYYFKSMVVGATVSGGANVNVGFATPIGITISLGFELGVNDSGATFVIAENEELGNRPRYYLTSGSDDSLIDKTDGSSKIDLFHLRKGGIDPYIREGTFNVNPYIKLTATAGVLANLINVSVNGSAQLNMTFFTSEEEDVGSISLNASIGVTVLFISASWPFFSKDIPLFGGNSTASLAGMDELNYLHDSSRVLQSEPRDYFKNRSKWNTAGVSVKSLDENENGVAQETLRNGIYSGTDVKLTALNDQGDYLGVFLDDETDASGKQVRDDINSAAVYYDVYDHETGWSDQPILLENDGKADQDVSVFDLGDRGIMVTWAAANKVFTEADSRVGMMNAMDIHGAFFDKKAKTFGQIMQITHETEQLKEDLGCDVYGDTSPNVVYNKDHMLVYYTKSDYAVSDEGEGEVIGDVIYPADSQMVYRVYKFTDTKGTEGTWIEDYKELPDYKASPEDSTYQGIVDGLQGGTATYEDYQKTYYGQVFFATAPDVYLDEQLDEDGYWKDNKAPEEYLGHNVSSNVTGKEETGVLPEKEKTEVSGDTDKVPVEYAPKIIDKDAISYNDLGLFAYTVDYDQSMSTVEDRDIYFQIYDFEAGTMSHPIMVTSDNVSDGNVRFIRVTSEERKLADTYLVWLSDGNIVGLNISNVVREDGCLKKKTSADNVDYYMIDKSRAENADDQKYIPPMTLVEGEVAEDQENAVSAISSFDVNSTDGFVYLSWTQQESALKDGVEEDSEEAAQAENQRVETQVYMARYDMAEDCMTKPVQVTSEEGANYDNLSFVVNSDATLTALATKAKSKTVTADEFNETIEEYNQTHSKDEKQDKVDEKDFVEYAAPDQVNKSLVMMNITPVSVMKVDEVTMDSLIAGEDNMISIRLLNDGIDTLTNAVLTVKDENGKSVLQEQKVSKPGEDGAVTAEYKTVDSITIDKLMGGNIYDASAKLALDEDAEDAAVTIQLTDASGRKLIDERHTGTISSDVLLQNFQVKETDERDVYDVTVDIQNSEARFAEAGEAVIGIEIPSEKKDETTDGETAVKKIELATVPVKSLARSESTTLEKQVKVDSLTQFIKSEGDNGFIHEKGTFYVEYRDQTLTEEVERTASGAQMNEVNSIQKGMIGDGSGMKVALGHIERAQANIKSSLADEKLGLTGTEGLQVLWKMDDESIATVDDMGNVSGIKEGSTKLTAYVMPKNSRVSASVDEGQSHEGYYFGNEESNYVSLPNDAIRKYTTTVTVKAEAAKQQTPAPSTGGKTVVKSGVTYRVSGSSASAVSAKKTITSVSVPATVKIGGKSYKVTKIAANAFKNCKKLKKATIGKNVISIDRNAFYGCTKLTKVSGGKNVRSIGKSAFYGCKKLTKITIGNKVKSIGSKAFYKCSKLTKVTIGKKVKSIGSKAFYGCKRVKTILFKPAKAPKIGSKAFKGVASKAVFRVPKKSRKKYRKVLKKKAGVTAKMKIKA